MGFVDGFFLMRRFLLLELLMVCIVKSNDALYYMKKMMISLHTSWYHILQNTAPPYLHENLLMLKTLKNGMDLLCQVVWLLQRNWLVPHPSGYLLAILTLLKLDSNTLQHSRCSIHWCEQMKKTINPPRPQPTYIGATQKTLLLSSESKGKEAPLIVTDADLWTDDGTAVYTDGDLSDQAEGGFTPEEIEPDFFVVIPAMAMHGMTGGQAPKFITSGENEEEVEDLRLRLRFIVADRRATAGQVFHPLYTLQIQVPFFIAQLKMIFKISASEFSNLLLLLVSYLEMVKPPGGREGGLPCRY